MVWKKWSLTTRIVLSTVFLVLLAVASLVFLVSQYGQQAFRAEDVIAIIYLGLGVGLVASALGIVVSWLMGRSIASPLRRMAKTAKDIVDGQAPRRFPVEGGRRPRRWPKR